MRPRFEERVLTAYQAFVDAAENGLPAPTNVALMKLCSYPGTGSASSLIMTLVDRGMIETETVKGNRRLVTIVATGQKTAAPKKANRYVFSRASLTKGRDRGAGKSARSSATRAAVPVTLTTMTDERWTA